MTENLLRESAEEEKVSYSDSKRKRWRSPIHPFLKWAGGKRWLIRDFPHFLPKRIVGKYYEPFLGSGSLFFHVRPREAVLSDSNVQLIRAFEGIKLQKQAVFSALKVHQLNHSSKYYYELREKTFDNIADHAAQFIYLNRTCFNGIYRVNRLGQFNVPLGSKTSVLLPKDNFGAWSKILSSAQLMHADFEEIISRSKAGDFVFADPPYTVRHNFNGFVKYNEVLFSWEDQERLAKVLLKARARGVRILMTNANHESVRSLYKKGFNLQVVSRFSSIAASGEDRNAFEELVIST